MRPIWSESGDFFAYMRASEGRREFYRLQISSGQRSPLFDRAEVARALAAACPDRVDPERLPLTLERLAGNGDSIARACGQLWRIPRDGSAIVIDAGNEDDAARSPDGQWDARVRGGNLFLKSRADGREIALTADGTPESFYARPVPDAAALRLNRPYFPDGPADVVWSSDSRRLATYRIDASGSGKLTLVQSTPPEGKRPRTLDYYYPLAGDERVPQARAMTFEVPSGRRVDLAHEPVPVLYYGGLGLQWRDDNLHVLFETTDRGRKSVSVIEGSALDGRTRVALRERSSTFVALQWDKWQLVDGWNQYLWIAERDDRPQLQLVDATSGKLARVLVDGAWSTLSVKHVDRKRGTVFFVGTGRDGPEPYLRRLYSVDRNGGPMRALTTEPVDHDVSLAPDGRHFIDNLSRADLPTRTVLRDARSGRVLRELATANIYRPARLDPARRYPVIDNIYTGPHYTMAPKSFERALTGRTANALAQLGFVVVLVDGRGTAGRSRAFIEPAYERLGSVGLDDHEAAMFHKPDFYKVGVAASGNHDHRSDKAWWNEIWMGFPIGPQYDRESNLTWAGKLQGKLMLAHGELDENVNPMATLQLVDALIDAN
ncbi:MAG: DPP IV N-terminal domain-containing protein [Steroidobacteraceae bacterium]